MTRTITMSVFTLVVFCLASFTMAYLVVGNWYMTLIMAMATLVVMATVTAVRWWHSG